MRLHGALAGPHLRRLGGVARPRTKPRQRHDHDTEHETRSVPDIASSSQNRDALLAERRRQQPLTQILRKYADGRLVAVTADSFEAGIGLIRTIGPIGLPIAAGSRSVEQVRSWPSGRVRA